MKNGNVFENLYELYREQKLAHAYLIETNDVEKCYQNVIEFCKKILCKKEYKSECNSCNICNLINNNSLPNLIVINPDGKSIKKGQIDDLKRSCINMPLLVDKNIYIIKYAETMNDTAYNKMLKFLEEPEDNIIGFYITNNKDNIPSTIISRLEVVKNYFDDITKNKLSEELKQSANKYINLLDNHDKNIIWYNETELLPLLKEKMDVINFFKYLFDYYFKETKNFKKSKLISKYLDELNYNVNTKLMIDSFALEMGDIDE